MMPSLLFMPIDRPLTAIDPESEKFMRFVQKTIESDSDLNKLLREISLRVQVSFSQRPATLKRKLRDKLIKGAHEHGAPLYESWQLDTEFEAECIDLIGWTLVRKYNEALKGGERYE
jgi:hypothetical protein